MSVLSEVLEWSEELPAWMRDALRRIITQQDLSEGDIQELSELCKKQYGLGNTGLQPVPLSSDHIPDGQQDKCISVASVSHVADVNALAEGQTLSFRRVGLTVVYGANGAGKSGYARILKRACRARGSSDPVLANAFSDQPGGSPRAQLEIEIDGVTRSCDWRDGSPCAPELAHVSVFDAAAAQVYVSDKTEVRFRPLGLDVLDKLARACGAVREHLDRERSALEGQAPNWPPIPEGTHARRFLDQLTALTSADKVQSETSFNENDKRDLDVLSKALAAMQIGDPHKRSADLRRQAGRMRRLAGELRTLYQHMGPESSPKMLQLRKDAEDAERAVQSLAESFEHAAQLPGLGSPEWRQMWHTARAYSEAKAYPESPFPHLAEDAHCVLCQQDLDESARDRLKKFDLLIKADAQGLAIAKARALSDRKKVLQGLQPGRSHADARSELAELNDRLASEVESFLKQAATVRDALVDGKAAGMALTASPPVAELEQLADDIEGTATELLSASDPKERERQEQRHAELQARRTLAPLKERILEEQQRLSRINAYERCLKDTQTQAISRLSTRLTKTYVTDALVIGFSEELRKIGFRALELELQVVGSHKGILYHQVKLRHANHIELRKVASEGELRAIALAAFFAELCSSGHRSAIVFDDPVSSLDHRWRTRIARRLAAEATHRQVIVFTHDLVFLKALADEAEAGAVECHSQSLRRDHHQAGHVNAELPWDAMKTRERLGWLRNEWQRVEKIFRTGSPDEYERGAAFIYGRLRQAWERAVEEVLLCSVVERYRRSVETQRLRDLDIRASDLEQVDKGMKKSSRWEGGHDHAPAENEPPPEPDELKMDIDALESWVSDIRKRQKAKK